MHTVLQLTFSLINYCLDPTATFSACRYSSFLYALQSQETKVRLEANVLELRSYFIFLFFVFWKNNDPFCRVLGIISLQSRGAQCQAPSWTCVHSAALHLVTRSTASCAASAFGVPHFILLLGEGSLVISGRDVARTTLWSSVGKSRALPP